MGYKGLVKSNVRLAFSAVKDLGDDVSFSQSNPTGFNFATNGLAGATPVVTTIKGIRLETGRDDDTNKITSKWMFKSEDLGDPSIYDSFTVDGVIWNIVHPYVDNGYTIELSANKEG